MPNKPSIWVGTKTKGCKAYNDYLAKYVVETVGAYTDWTEAQRKMNFGKKEKYHTTIANFAEVGNSNEAEWTGAFSGPPAKVASPSTDRLLQLLDFVKEDANKITGAPFTISMEEWREHNLTVIEALYEQVLVRLFELEKEMAATGYPPMMALNYRVWSGDADDVSRTEDTLLAPSKAVAVDLVKIKEAFDATLKVSTIVLNNFNDNWNVLCAGKWQK